VYDDIDGKHLWQYVKEQADISRRYRDAGHPQYWGRIAGTSGDVESEQWLRAESRAAVIDAAVVQHLRRPGKQVLLRATMRES
jgi:hypothetical protein